MIKEQINKAEMTIEKFRQSIELLFENTQRNKETDYMMAAQFDLVNEKVNRLLVKKDPSILKESFYIPKGKEGPLEPLKSQKSLPSEAKPRGSISQMSRHSGTPRDRPTSPIGLPAIRSQSRGSSRKSVDLQNNSKLCHSVIVNEYSHEIN